MIERVEFGGELFALIVRGSYGEDGAKFVTAQSNPLQLGILRHKQGVQVKPHVHRNTPRMISEVQEVLHVEYGEVEAEFYDARNTKVGGVRLRAGDTALLTSGGHGFLIVEECKMIEVKQGPYLGTAEDKEYLNPA